VAGFENMFCGKTAVRVTKLPAGDIAIEAWIPVPGAPEGQYWLGYTGPMLLAHYHSVNVFHSPPWGNYPDLRTNDETQSSVGNSS
jgi:hypothetical protein